jgi:caa(3)-type oxidase subunit IV
MSDHDSERHGPSHYIKLYFILLGLFAISVAGPFVAEFLPEGAGRVWLVLITAFGIAFVKAYLVVAKFMHLDIEKPIARWLLGTALMFMVLFFAGVSPDVMKGEGTNWVKTAEIDWHQTSAAYRAKHGEGVHHGDDSEHGDTEHGEPEHGEPEHGEPEHGEPEHGDSEHGEPEHQDAGGTEHHDEGGEGDGH